MGDRTLWMRFAYWPEARSAADLLQSDVGRTLRTLLQEFRELNTPHGIVPIVVCIPC